MRPIFSTLGAKRGGCRSYWRRSRHSQTTRLLSIKFRYRVSTIRTATIRRYAQRLAVVRQAARSAFLVHGRAVELTAPLALGLPLDAVKDVKGPDVRVSSGLASPRNIFSRRF